MSLFGKLVKTAVNVSLLPVAIVVDTVTLGGVSTKGKLDPDTLKLLQKIKDEADD